MDESAFRNPHSAIDTRCPTCRAPWRDVTTCTRCGTDLTALMRVAVRAWELREAARAALGAGDRTADALALAHAACRLHTTPQGQRLLALALLAAGQMAEAHEVIERLLPDNPEEAAG
jgi:hypothetical protein